MTRRRLDHPRLASALVLGAVLLAACSGGGTNATTTSGSGRAASGGSPRGAAARPADVKPVTVPVRVVWESTKHENTRHALINQSHPVAKRPIPLSDKTKVITDVQMAALLAYMERDLGFFRLASGSFSRGSLPVARANGYVSVERDGRTWGLVFMKGTRAADSAIPTTYVECKKAIIGVFNESGAAQAYTTRPGDRVLGIDRTDAEGSGTRK